jgi:hypothetical protein
MRQKYDINKNQNVHLVMVVLERKSLMFSTNKDAFDYFPLISSLIYLNLA